MPSIRTSRASTQARDDTLGQLKEDHKRVKKAYRQFQKLDVESDSEACATLVTTVLDELTVHAALEEEILYPAARSAIEDVDLVDEAEVEHGSLHSLIEQLRGMAPEDDKYAAHFTVLCEYVLHHVKEEEGEMFPQLEAARLDWQALAAEMTERRAELEGEFAEGVEGVEGVEEDADDAGNTLTSVGEDAGESEDDNAEEAGDPVGKNPDAQRGRKPRAGRTAGL